MAYETDVKKHTRSHPTKPYKEVTVRKHKRTIQGTRKHLQQGNLIRARMAKAAARSSGDRWTYDPRAIPGEPSYYLDVQETGDLDDATAVIIENDSGGFEVREKTGEFRGSFHSLEEAQKTAERWRTTFVPMQNIKDWDEPPYPPTIRIDRDDPWTKHLSEQRLVEDAINKRIRAVIDGRKGWSWQAGRERDMELADEEIQRLSEMKRRYLEGIANNQYTQPDGTKEFQYDDGVIKLYSEKKSWDTNPPPKTAKEKKRMQLKRALSVKLRNSNEEKQWDKPPYPDEVVIHVKKGDWLTSQQVEPYLRRRMKRIDEYLNATYWRDADPDEAGNYNKAFWEQDRLRIMGLNAGRVRGNWTQGKTDDGHDYDRFSFEDGDVVVIQDG